MATYSTERVTAVHHWNGDLFSFRTTRRAGLRFRNGQFVMVGLEAATRPIARAYSIASANYAEHLEFFSIKVPDGPLTSRLQKIRVGDEILVSHKPTGSLVLDDLRPGKRLWMLATGTGLAPFLSLIRDPEVYERFEQVCLVHGVRRESDLAYRRLIEEELPENVFLGEQVRDQLHYLPLVTREPFPTPGRISTRIAQNTLGAPLGLPELDSEQDRLMLCGSPAMLADCQALLDARGFEVSPSIGEPGDYVIERAFVAR